jgi:glutaredoxin-like protein
MLSPKDREFLQGHLAHTLEKPVKLLLFTQTVACQFCQETEQVLTELAELSDRISLEVYSFMADQEMVKRYGIDKIPATVVMSDVDYGIRFYGIPSGYEFTSLIEDVIDVSQGSTGLSAATLAQITAIQQPVHLQVFVTPTCPYCPAAVRLAHSLAIASTKIRADMVESIEFPQLANKYHVHGVPKTVINESTTVEGAAPEPLLVARVLQSVGLMSQEDVEALAETMQHGAQEA